MNRRGHPFTNRGFTIVELLIVIVVIGILAAIVITAFNGVQKAASTATIKSDLSNATRAMGITQAETGGAYPDVLPPSIKTSPGVIVELIKTTGGYSGLSNVQMGVLYQTMCQQLVNEGFGTGTNIGGGVEQYVTGCNVYNNNALQINGWNAHNFLTPITTSSVYAWYDANITSDVFRPNKKTVVLSFATELTTRFQSLGGSYPVTTFWDPWAAPNNSGVPYQSLPAPDAPSDPNTFCIEATHVKYADVVFHATQGTPATTGSCP